MSLLLTVITTKQVSLFLFFCIVCCALARVQCIVCFVHAMPSLLLRPLSGSRVAMATAAPPCAAAAERRLASQAAPSAGRKRPFSSTSAGRVDEVGSVVFHYLSVILTLS
jgi:hypothetical protein